MSLVPPQDNPYVLCGYTRHDSNPAFAHAKRIADQTHSRVIVLGDKIFRIYQHAGITEVIDSFRHTIILRVHDWTLEQAEAWVRL